jgi:hypothetical protein
MSAFRLIADDRAGPTALGILAPPGRRTYLILRPRGLPWDLVLVQASRNGPATAFREMGRDEADAATDTVHRALLDGAGSVHAVPAADEGYHLRAQVGAASFLACTRNPGKPYSLVTFADAGTASAAVDALRPVLCPAADAGQELYFNTRHFAR